jgi:hypothetical protein
MLAVSGNTIQVAVRPYVGLLAFHRQSGKCFFSVELTVILINVRINVSSIIAIACETVAVVLVYTSYRLFVDRMMTRAVLIGRLDETVFGATILSLFHHFSRTIDKRVHHLTPLAVSSNISPDSFGDRVICEIRLKKYDMLKQNIGLNVV